MNSNFFEETVSVESKKVRLKPILYIVIMSVLDCIALIHFFCIIKNLVLTLYIVGCIFQNTLILISKGKVKYI